MRNLKILLPLVCAALLSSCRTSKPDSAPPPTAQAMATSAAPDTSAAPLPPHPDSVVIQPAPTWLDKVLGRTPPPAVYQALPARIGKKSTVQVYYGSTVTNTVAGKKAQVAVGDGATASAVGKKAGPAIVGSDSAVQVLSGGGAVALGAGAHAAGGATIQQPLDWRAVLAQPIGLVGGAIAGVLGLAVLGYGAYLIVMWRRKKSTDNQA